MNADYSQDPPPTRGSDDLAWATTTERSQYNAEMRAAVYRAETSTQMLQQVERWLTRDEQEPGFLPTLQKKSILAGLEAQRATNTRMCQLVNEYLRERDSTDPTVEEIETVLEDALAAARLENPGVRTCILVLSPFAWKTVAAAWVQEDEERVKWIENVRVQLSSGGDEVADRLVLKCAGQYQVRYIPPAQASYRDLGFLYAQLRIAGYNREQAAQLAGDVVANTETPSNEQEKSGGQADTPIMTRVRGAVSIENTRYAPLPDGH